MKYGTELITLYVYICLVCRRFNP